MSKLQRFRAVVTERLAAVAEDISLLFERTIAEYEEELCRSKVENQRKQQLLDTVLNPRVLLLRVDTGPSLNQELTEIPQIKEEQRSITPDPELLRVSVPGSSVVCVKREESSPLQERQTKQREETQGEDISSELHLHSEIEGPVEHSSETDKDDDWTAPIETEDYDDQYNEVQNRDKSTNPSPQNNAAPETSGTLKNGKMSGTNRGAKRKKNVNKVCQKRFGEKGTLLKHTQVHTGQTPHSCSFCKKTFAHGTDLARHKRTHTGEKPYSCPVCKKTFASKGELVKHNRTHTGEKPYNCSVCQKAFTQSCNLATHEKTHTGEKPYNCSVCQKTFAQSSSLALHKRMHTGEKPYSCPVCKKTFTRSSSLALHKRTHTGEKPHSCTVCKKTFGRKDHLNAHKRTHTKEKSHSF